MLVCQRWCLGEKDPVDVSPIRASSTLRISIFGIKFTKSEKALNKLQNNNLQREQRNKKKFT